MIDPPPGQMTLPDIVAAAFNAYRRAPLAWLAITLLLFAAMFGLYWALGDELDLPADASEEQIEEAAPAAGAVLGVGLLLTIFTHIALVDGAARALAGKPVGVGAAYRAGLRRFLTVIAALAVSGAVVVLLSVTILLLPLALYFGVLWSMAIPAIVVERVGPLRSLSRSRQIVRGRWWPTLGVTLGVVVLGLLPGFVFSWIGDAIDTTWATALAAALAACVSAPFNSLALTLLYADLRARKGEKPFEPLPELVT